MAHARNLLQVLTLLLTIIFSRSLLMSANTGLLSGSCFQHCSIRLYLVGRADRQLQLSKNCPVTITTSSTVLGSWIVVFPNSKAVSVSLISFSELGQGLSSHQGLRGPGTVVQHPVSYPSLERFVSTSLSGTLINS